MYSFVTDKEKSAFGLNMRRLDNADEDLRCEFLKGL
jgi:hypothetical protein